MACDSTPDIVRERAGEAMAAFGGFRAEVEAFIEKTNGPKHETGNEPQPKGP